MSSPIIIAAAADNGSAGLALFIGGAVLVSIAVGKALVTRRMLATWRRANAMVTANIRRSIGGGNHDEFPVYTFTTAAGDVVSVQQQSNRPRMTVGQQVVVLHHPRDPNRTIVQHWVSLHLAAVLLSALGAVVLVMAAMVMRS